MKKYITIFVFFSLFIGGLSAFAESHNDGSVKANINSSIKIKIGSELESEDSNMASTSLDGSIKEDISDNADEDGRRNSTTTKSDETSDSADASVGSQIRMTARELRDWDTEKKSEFLTGLKTVIEVKTDKDLEDFAQGALLKDENVDSVSVDNDNVKIVYNQPAKFLGFISTTISTDITASSKDDIKVKMPWYRFLFKVEKEVDENLLKEDASQKISADANVKLDNVVAVKARIIEALIAGLRAQENASAEVNGNVN